MVNNPFTINSGFLPGINTLEFLAFNGGLVDGPHGIRIEIFGTAEVVPEPASVALLGLGSIALVGLGWRRRRRGQ